MPTLLVSATCAFIGIDFLWDSLGSKIAERRGGAAAAAAAVFGACLYLGMLGGVVVGVIACRLYALVTRPRAKVD